jgi:hypothetical protein
MFRPRPCGAFKYSSQRCSSCTMQGPYLPASFKPTVDATINVVQPGANSLHQGQSNYLGPSRPMGGGEIASQSSRSFSCPTNGQAISEERQLEQELEVCCKLYKHLSSRTAKVGHRTAKELLHCPFFSGALRRLAVFWKKASPRGWCGPAAPQSAA